MIFSELYSTYYTTVARILGEAVKGDLNERRMKEIVERNAFSESMLLLLPMLKGPRWHLLKEDLSTPLTHVPTMPLTLLEKRWLKAISLDPRIRLFDIPMDGQDGVEPLFTDADYCVFDRYSDGDPFTDDGYVERFRLILDAIRNRYPLRIEMQTRRGNPVQMKVMPARLEYSAKDDKFRLLSTGCRYGEVINLGRILSCKPCLGAELSDQPYRMGDFKSVTLLLYDARNTLERVMLHFAHFEKQAERIDDMHYRLTLRYHPSDETELVIRILSFGPTVKVEEPAEMVGLIRQRLLSQQKYEI